jgi:hypothetical protein
MKCVFKPLKLLFFTLTLFWGSFSLMAQTKYIDSHLKPTFTDGLDTGGFMILGSGAVLGIGLKAGLIRRVVSVLD